MARAYAVRRNADLNIAPSAVVVGAEVANVPGENRVSSGHRTVSSNGNSPAVNRRMGKWGSGQSGRGRTVMGMSPVVLIGLAVAAYIVLKKF